MKIEIRRSPTELKTISKKSTESLTVVSSIFMHFNLKGELEDNYTDN